MNNESAKKGFKTFLLTLSISLIVFSTIYYFLTQVPTQAPTQPVPSTPTSAIENKETKEVAALPTEEAKPTSAFAQLASIKTSETPQRAVLAGATVAPQTTQSTTSVPSTGIMSITLGLFASFTAFVLAVIYTSRDPRKQALSSFEKNVLDKMN